jgi:hypothetical protein
MVKRSILRDGLGPFLRANARIATKTSLFYFYLTTKLGLATGLSQYDDSQTVFEACIVKA